MRGVVFLSFNTGLCQSGSEIFALVSLYGCTTISNCRMFGKRLTVAHRATHKSGRTMTDKKISADALQALGERVLTALDLPPSDARTIAGLMEKADLFGADGHGMFRLRRYVDRLRAGG